MTDHDVLQRQLFALYDGELTGSARQEMEDHLAGCPACRERLIGFEENLLGGVFGERGIPQQ